MPIKVRIPTPLRNLTGGRGELETDGKDVAELIENIERQFPGMKSRLYDEQGQIRRFVNIYINEEDIRFLSGPSTPLKDGDEVSIIPAIAGGAIMSYGHFQGRGRLHPALPVEGEWSLPLQQEDSWRV
jgi:molybdopterin synthase sulfur carrier subunit